MVVLIVISRCDNTLLTCLLRKDSPFRKDCLKCSLSSNSSLPGVEDHERPVLNLLPGALLVLVFVVGIVLRTGHGVAAVLAVAAAAAVHTTASSSGDGGSSGGRTFIEQRGEGVLFG